GTTEDSSILVMTESSDKKVFLLYPDGFLEWDELSKHLSLELQCPVFSFHIHDGDLWMFVFFVRGEEVTRFNPIPNYWDDGISDEEMQSWQGDVSLVCSYWPGITEESIIRYFTRWNLEAESQEKAYPDDEFEFGSDWQMCDFIKKLGLVYPMDKKGNLLGKTYFLSVE
ncbi:MAG: hypothetical protein RL616_2576, partial [Verrucomicrobiota bacterium]